MFSALDFVTEMNVMIAAGFICLALLTQGCAGQRQTTPAPVYSRTYIVLAPNTIHPGLPLSLSVSILDAASDVVVTATILKTEELTETSVVSVSETFSPGATRVAGLVMPADEQGDSYKLRIEGSGGLEFSQTEDLKFSPKSFAILVQTDKAIYKPGQTVHFRAMAIYPDLKPYMGTFDVILKDPNGNVIQQWMNLQNTTYGVVSGETVMSETPVLGDWVITVTANNNAYDHTITIDEYVLPKFEVTVTPPPYIVSTDTQATISVEAKYTYGEPVKGTVSMDLQVLGGGKPYHVEFEIDGKGETVVTKAELADLYYGNLYRWARFTCTANVTESLTGIQQTGVGYFGYEEKPIKVAELPGNPEVFKPGLLYTAYVKVTHVDETSLTDAERRRRLVVTHSYTVSGSRESVDAIDAEVVIPEDGIIKLDFSFPTEAVSANFLVAYYYDNNERAYGYDVQKYLSPANSPSSEFLQIIAQGASLQAGTQASFEIRTTEVPPKLTYQVFSKGNIVLANSLTSVTSTNTVLTIDVTSAMAPQARLVVSYVRPDNHELVLDSININVEGAFENEVTINFNKEEVEPGEGIKLDITAERNAYVGVLAIDTSVMLLKTGNDITQSMVVDALEDFDTTSSGNDGYVYDVGFGRAVARRKRSAWCCGWWPFPIPGDTAREVLNSAGILVFTDALVYGETAPDVYSGRMAFEYAERMPSPRADSGQGVAPKRPSTPKSIPNSPKVRSEFPETWLWSHYVVGDDGRVRVASTVPDTITSWVASAFSMSAQTGIGVAESTAQLRVFRPFFVSLTLPYSVIRGEKLVLQATVFNYLAFPVQATVTLSGSVEFQSLSYDENGSEKISNSDQVKSVKVPASGGATVYFPILPQKLGTVDLSVSATTEKAADAVVRQLLVEPEGIPTSFSEPVFIDFNSTQGTLSKEFTFGFPKDLLIPGSVRAQLTVTGDIMGPTMSGLDKLLQLPSGCGEQTMLSFAPDVFIYSYLESTNQDNPTVMQKAKDFMKKGYQRELNYQHTDHSFSAFGNSDPSGSTWLTAFVIKCFAQAKPFIFIDSTVVQRSVEWLIAQQTRDGVFNEPGKVIHTAMQGGVSSDVTMTAYVLIALEEVKGQRVALNLPQTFWDHVDNSISLAVGFLEEQYNRVSGDVYAVALVTYALTLADSQDTRFLDALERLAVVEDGVKHWVDPATADEQVDGWFCYYYPPPSADIEMTGYALLTYLARNEIARAAPVARWLTDQRNEYGGYGSTQDTVIGLQALSTYAGRLSMTPRNISIDVTATDSPDYSSRITVNDGNSIILQKLELPVTSGTVQTTISGTGSCLMQFTAFYNLAEVQVRPSFELTVTMLDLNKNTVNIMACGRYVGGNDVTGMSMIEIGLPSGFYADEDALKSEVKAKDNLQKYEVGRRTVYLYLNALTRNTEYCFNVVARRDKIVANLKPSNAVIYDYYKPGDQTVVSYSSKSLSESSVCQTCPTCCGLDPDSAGVRLTGQVVLVAVATLLSILY
ncbi:CD109 antigen-like isoform X2 [Acanthaster planci]|uniref:CD109 antigen-like isoform X2 n=1 Tax=Acanthaster planci TaxID=133434 RepID=A0A8B7XSR5_ACAPL|nr:CD109 antigen-like isoform X2 [Acanthaster planci]